MSLWDRCVWVLVMTAVVVALGAVNELRAHDFVTAGILVAVGCGLFGLSRVIRWVERD